MVSKYDVTSLQPKYGNVMKIIGKRGFVDIPLQRTISLETVLQLRFSLMTFGEVPSLQMVDLHDISKTTRYPSTCKTTEISREQSNIVGPTKSCFLKFKVMKNVALIGCHGMQFSDN